jgi:hypothetical protein
MPDSSWAVIDDIKVQVGEDLRRRHRMEWRELKRYRRSRATCRTTPFLQKLSKDFSDANGQEDPQCLPLDKEAVDFGSRRSVFNACPLVFPHAGDPARSSLSL